MPWVRRREGERVTKFCNRVSRHCYIFWVGVEFITTSSHNSLLLLLLTNFPVLQKTGIDKCSGLVASLYHAVFNSLIIGLVQCT